MSILMENVCYSYDTREKDAFIKDLNLNIQSSGLTALIGDNGSGKTTIGKLMAGILKPSSGRILINGGNTQEMSLGEIGGKVGYMFQEPGRQIFAPTVEEELSFVLKIKGVEKVRIDQMVTEMLSRFHLTHLRDKFPFYLSRGEKQRLALAAILINKPKFLILDEPTTALDIKRKAELLEILKKLLQDGVGMLVISHDHKFVKEHATRVIEVVRGEVSHGS